MIKFLKINDPYRLAVLAIFFLAARAIVFLFEIPFTYSELKFFLVARAMENGKWLYKDVWETAEPLTAFLYYLLPNNVVVFSATAYWLNVILVLFNAFFINIQFIRHDVLNEKTNLPAFFYLFLSFSSIELNVFSAPLMASSFLLLVANKMFFYLKKEESQQLYSIGFFLSIASLLYLPSIVFFLVILISLIVFTRSELKSYFLLILGCVFPWMVLLVVFLWNDGFVEFTNVFLAKYFKFRQNYIFWSEVAYILLIPALVFLSALYLSLRDRIREINYQNICRKFVFIWLMGCLLLFLIAPITTLSFLHIAIMPLAFFYTFYFTQTNKTLIASILLILAFVVMLLVEVRSAVGLAWRGSMRKIIVQRNEQDTVKGKRLFVVGESVAYYLDNTLATKYLNWEVSKQELVNTQEFTSIESVKRTFEKEMPEMIIDQKHIMPSIFKRIPSLQEAYSLERPGIYVLKKKK